MVTMAILHAILFMTVIGEQRITMEIINFARRRAPSGAFSVDLVSITLRMTGAEKSVSQLE